MKSENNIHDSYTVVQLDNLQAMALASEIVSVYRDSWLETYPNKELGITENDLLSRFSDMLCVIEEWRSNILASKERLTWVVKNQQGKILGFCIARKGDEYQELEYLYIMRVIQGKGFGHQLITKAIEWMQNSKPVFLVGAAYNHKAIQFYKKYGFELSPEHIPPKKLPNGKELPSMKMIKNIINTKA